MKKKILKAIGLIFVIAIAVTSLSVCAFAQGGGDIAGAIENTWDTASVQIKQVVNNVVFPVIDLILAVFFFAKLALHILIIAAADTLSGRLRLFYLLV